MSQAIGNARGVMWFLVLAFALAWLWFFVVWLVRVPLLSPAGQLFLLPAGFAPLAAICGLLYIIDFRPNASKFPA
jgi:hypothetical protein